MKRSRREKITNELSDEEEKIDKLVNLLSIDLF
jgi:hypothetical protein